MLGNFSCDPLDGAILGPMGHNLNKLGSGRLDDASYQILRLLDIRDLT